MADARREHCLAEMLHDWMAPKSTSMESSEPPPDDRKFTRLLRRLLIWADSFISWLAIYCSPIGSVICTTQSSPRIWAQRAFLLEHLSPEAEGALRVPCNAWLYSSCVAIDEGWSEAQHSCHAWPAGPDVLDWPAPSSFIYRLLLLAWPMWTTHLGPHAPRCCIAATGLYYRSQSKASECNDHFHDILDLMATGGSHGGCTSHRARHVIDWPDINAARRKTLSVKHTFNQIQGLHAVVAWVLDITWMTEMRL
ncbi:hypothetical protein DOTSEDRAFT_78784 [Dothistroma septosporum NZE10]|uniref:Uncharacterized protein n=1 Tax=Dothistroma septosporum (strain NZE10 / CBS 128990) TaxID=675120 RepID=N1PSU1_DOTSN|nr:hypothetical protein DOTSEDRAFT_78784 [Dothistroma septosporum NZE10]